MEQLLQLKMDKPTLNNNGFTLVESLFTISLILLLCMLSLSMIHQDEKQVEKRIEEEFIAVTSLLEEARTYAIVNHQQVDIEITNTTISYVHKDTGKRTIALGKGLYFSGLKKIHFSKYGNFNKGNHILIGNDLHQRKIVFHIGGGDFVLQ